MTNKNFKDIRITLPSEVVNSFQSGEIVAMVLDKTMTKMTYYLSRCNEMEQKYGMGYSAFRKKVNTSSKEKYSQWDDLIVWEGYLLAYREWNEKFKQMKQCTQ